MSSRDIEENCRRAELVSGISILERFGIIDFNGHCSIRLGDGRVLINSGASVRSAVRAEDIVVVHGHGDVADDSPKPPGELPLHMAVYRQRADVRAVVHGHPVDSTLLSSAGRPYEVTFAQGALLGEVAVYPSPQSVNNDKTAAEVAATLGTNRAALLRAHGCVVTGSDLLEAVVMAIYLELNAKRQIEAAPLGGPYVFSSEEAAACCENLNKRGLFEKCWNYYLAKYQLL